MFGSFEHKNYLIAYAVLHKPNLDSRLMMNLKMMNVVCGSPLNPNLHLYFHSLALKVQNRTVYHLFKSAETDTDRSLSSFIFKFTLNRDIRQEI